MVGKSAPEGGSGQMQEMAKISLQSLVALVSGEGSPTKLKFLLMHFSNMELAKAPGPQVHTSNQL